MTKFHLDLLWAVGEQLALHDRFDAGFIAHIRETTPPSQEKLQSFMETYGLSGRGSGVSADQIRDVIAIAEASFRGRPVDEIAAQTKWVNASTTLHLNRPSLFAKLYWFYQPGASVTMFDKFVRRGLPELEKERFGRRGRGGLPDAYFRRFEAVFQDVADEVEWAVGQHARQYPYPRRVLDKVLWARGQEPAVIEQIRDSFLASLADAPIGEIAPECVLQAASLRELRETD